MWAVVVVSWNGRDDTLACLASVRALDRDDCAIVCVDNGSSDGSAAAVRAAFPEAAVIETGANLGFAGGNNAGIRHALAAGADWVLLLNNDAVVAPDALDAFEAAAAAHPRAGVLAGKVLYADPPDRVWFAGQRFFPRLGYSGRARGFRRPDGPRYSRPGRTARACGAFMAVSRAAIERGGLLDEALFLYVEDVEWSARLRRCGFEVRFEPTARAWHRVSAASGGEAASTAALYYGTRNTVVVCERLAPLPAPLDRLRRFVIEATWLAHALTKPGRRRAVAAVRAGYRDARAGRLGPRASARS